MSTTSRVTPFKEYLERKLQDPEFRSEYEALGPRFDLIAALVQLRAAAGLTQEQLAERVGTKREAIARIENKPGNLTLKTLARIAGALDADLEIRLIPAGEQPPIEVCIPARSLLAEKRLDRFE